MRSNCYEEKNKQHENQDKDKLLNDYSLVVEKPKIWRANFLRYVFIPLIEAHISNLNLNLKAQNEKAVNSNLYSFYF